MHIVHKNDDASALSVVAVYFDTKVGGSTPSAFLNGLITAQNNTNTTNKIEWIPSSVELETLLNSLNMTKLLNYEGSLTTPSCNEIVEWNVIVDPQPISAAQLQFFTRKWGGNSTFAKGRGNNRVAQPVGDRSIYYYGGPAVESSTTFVKVAISSLVMMIIAVFA